MDELPSNGEFAVRRGLSPTMLRSYAAAGLLVPAAVDRVDQLPRAELIRLLRRAEVAVDEIGGFLVRPGTERLDRWESRIVQATAEQRRALAAARWGAGSPSRPSWLPPPRTAA